MFCYDLASLARLDVAETCYPHSLQFIGTFPSSDTILKQPPYLLFNPHLSSHFTTLPPQKQAVQTERISDMNVHILVASEEVPHVQSNIIFLPNISLKNLAHFSGVLCCKIYLCSLQGKNNSKGKKISKDCTENDMWGSAETNQ